MNPVDPHDLKTFLAIATQRSFRKAAVELRVTPSAVSHALRELEERIGLRLLNRTTRSVSLTEAGERLLERIRPAFLDLDAAVEELNVFRKAPVGSLRLNAARVATRLALLPVVARFLAKYPEVRVEIVTDEALSDIVAKGCDAGLRFGESIAADMITVPCGGRHRFAVVGAPSYFKDRSTPRTPRDLKQHRCIRYRFASGKFYRWEFERRSVEVDVEVSGTLTLGDMDLMVDAALSGAGLAYVFEDQVQPYLKNGRLIRVLEDYCPPYPGFFLYYPSRRQLPAALRAFVEFVKADTQRVR